MAHYHRKRIFLPGTVVFDPIGVELQPQEREMIAHPAVGGVILFAHNFEEPQQLADLVRCCREARSGELLLMVDQEGGRVQRFREGFSVLPKAAKFGIAYDQDKKRALEAARDVACLCALELKAIGVDLNLAPVADLQTDSLVIGERAYHEHPNIAANLAAAAVNGFQLAGVSATAKHFPGHGGVLEDTHLNDASDERELADIMTNDLRVFQKLIEAGVDAMMPAHVVFPAVDDCPAGYSSRWVKDILRDDLGFGGAVLSDDLGMAAAGVAGEEPSRAEAALGAGCDLALMCQNPVAAEAVIDCLSGIAFDEDRAQRVLLLRREEQEFDHVATRRRAEQALSWLNSCA